MGPSMMASSIFTPVITKPNGVKFNARCIKHVKFVEYQCHCTRMGQNMKPDGPKKKVAWLQD